MKIAAPHLGNLFGYAAYRGVSESVLRNCLSYPQLDVYTLENSVSDTEFLNILMTFSKQTKDDYLGLHFGYFLNIKSLGFVNQLSLNANNLEQAVFILQNYLQSTFPIVRLLATINQENYVLKLESDIENKTLKRHVLDMTYCFIYRELQLIIPKDVEPILTLPNLEDSQYSIFLNTKIVTDNVHSFIFKKRILNIAINQKRVKEIEFLLPKFLQLLDKQNIELFSFSVQIRNVILNMCSPELPTFEQVAVHFPLSHRTIQH
jgi:hypothetical protein